MTKQSFRIAYANARVALGKGKCDPVCDFYFYNCHTRGIVIGRLDGEELRNTSKDLLHNVIMPASYRRLVINSARRAGPLPLPR